MYVDKVLQGTITGTPTSALVAEGVVIGNDQDSVLGGWDIGA